MKRGVKRRVVISTIYRGKAVRHAIPKLSPDKLILLIDEPFYKKEKEEMYEVINSIKKLFKNTFDIETTKISSYDIPKIMSETGNIIDREFKKGNKIIVHITEGRKITSLALLFASYMKKDKVEGAYYITQEDHELINLPMLSFKVNGNKKILLKEINNGLDTPNKLIEKLKFGRSATYQHIQELKREEYIEDSKKLKLTDLGRMMIL